MSFSHPPVKFAWKTKAEYQFKNPPVKDTEYTVFDETGGVKLISLCLIETNTETDAKDIDCIITLDGTDYTYDASVIGGLAHNQRGSFFLYATEGGAGPIVLDLVLGVTQPHDFIMTEEGGKPLEAHTMKVVLKMTSNAGTAQTLKYMCVYAVLEAV
jgi:hypothetical protein